MNLFFVLNVTIIVVGGVSIPRHTLIVFHLKPLKGRSFRPEKTHSNTGIGPCFHVLEHSQLSLIHFCRKK